MTGKTESEARSPASVGEHRPTGGSRFAHRVLVRPSVTRLMQRLARRRASRAGTVALLGGCLAVAAGSLLLGFALSYDAWGWLIWGRELVGHLPFTTDGYPTWKPLTGLIAIPLAPLGGAGPLLWLLIARFGAVLSLVLAFRLGRRVAGPGAGVLAAASLLLMPDWVFQAGVGGSEPLLTALLLGAVARHANRDDGVAFALVLLASLLRPEAWGPLLVSSMVTWGRRPAIRPLVVAGLVAVPVLWLGGDYLGSGNPFRGAVLAKMSAEAHELRRSGVPPAVGVLNRAWPMVLLPLLACAPVGLVYGLRRRDPILMTLALGGLAWVAEVAALATLGYAGVTRFLFPAAAGLAVVGAAGLVLLVRSSAATPALRLGLAVVLVALAVPSVPRIQATGREATRVEARTDLEQALSRLVAHFGARALRATPDLSSEGVEVTGFAWRIGALPGPLKKLRVPGLRVALRDRGWAPFWRSMSQRRGLFETETILHDGRLFLIAVEPRATDAQEDRRRAGGLAAAVRRGRVKRSRLTSCTASTNRLGRYGTSLPVRYRCTVGPTQATTSAGRAEARGSKRST